MTRESEVNRELFEEMPVPKAVMTMAIPMVVSQLIILIYNMADTFFIGRVNNYYMVAGAALILPIFNLSAPARRGRRARSRRSASGSPSGRGCSSRCAR